MPPQNSEFDIRRRDFTEEELKLEEEGANRTIEIGFGRPILVDPNAWVCNNFEAMYAAMQKK